MTLSVITDIACAIIGFIGCAIPSIITIVKYAKKVSSSKTAEEKTAAINDMLEHVDTFIIDAEKLYLEVDAVLKQRHLTAGAVKKDTVMTKLQAYAIEKNYEFDSEYWSKKIDERVYLTKEVNK